jgi:NitT/TauT family transport system ATP-binding protein
VLEALTGRTLQDELLRIWAALVKTIIFVTHSIDEAIYLGSRVVVMTYRPGTIKSACRARAIRAARHSKPSAKGWGRC